MTADADSPVVRLANALLLAAIKQRAQFVVVTPGLVRFVVDGQWRVEMEPPLALCPFVVRRFGVMSNLMLPGKGGYACGRIELVIGAAHHYFLVRIERDDQDVQQARALIELVSEAEYGVRGEPMVPTTHPFR
jgi:type II secretory ATPase GspE/PulE/Tfp pilus assembly ATPase PilB-like protein